MVSAFLRGTVELLAAETRSIPEGRLAFTPSLPDTWWLNGVWLETPMSYEDAVALCERHRRGHYDQLFVSEEAGGEVLEPAFRAAGWRVEVDVQSILAGGPDRGVDTSAVVEPGLEESLALVARWVKEDRTLALSQDSVDQLVEANRRAWSLRNARHFGVSGRDGELVATTVLFSDGHVAQIEDVYVVPEARGRGHGRAIVAAAARAGAAEHGLTFIVADDNDWPKQLYAKLGFKPVSRSWSFHRELGGSQPDPRPV